MMRRNSRDETLACSTVVAKMADEEGEYIQSFVQADDSALEAAIKQRDAAVTPLLRPGGGSAAQALPLALADPPYQTRNDALKNAAFDVVCKVLLAIKDAEISSAVDALTLEQCDVLMKYLYRGLGPAGKKNDVYAVLLKWHPVVLKRGGHGSIMRAISEVNQAL